jgi:hypothetical protein
MIGMIRPHQVFDELSADRLIHHVGDTMLCAWFNGAAEAPFARPVGRP